MKKAVTIFLGLALLSITLFGAIAMINAASHDSCISAIMGQSACPSGNDLAEVNVHVNSLKTFSSAIFEVGALPGSLAIAIGLMLLLLAKFFIVLSQQSALIAIPQVRIRQRTNHVRATLQTLKWTQRLQNSPSVA